MILSTQLPHQTRVAILNKFVKLMVLPAVIIVFQFLYQKTTGLTNPLTLEAFVPDSLLLPGYVYEANYPWYSTFVRPNGFFFLETSFASGFVALAMIIEATHSRRRFILLLMLSATLLSMGRTGMVLLLCAAFVSIFRGKSLTRLIAAVGICVAIMLLFTVRGDSQLSENNSELDDRESSGFGRLVTPAQELATMLSDTRYWFRGDGPGSISPNYGSAWPVVKLIKEYGVLITIIFFVYFFLCIGAAILSPPQFALCFVYLFTGGYLLSPVMTQLIILFCCFLTTNETLKCKAKMVD